VLVEDGQMVFIGGLIANDTSNAHQGIPFLEDIPYLGRLFSSSEETANTTETVVLLKPKIIRSNTLALITEPKKDVEKFEKEIDKKNQRIEKFFDKQSDLWEAPKLPH
jgi:type II secretory pathway component GspD/PulD (secretin)